MLRYALTSLRANLTRLGATALAVVIGITFLASGLMLTDAMRAGLTGDVETRYESVDLALVARSSESGFGLLQTVPAGTVDVALATDGVAAAAGEIVADARVLDEDGSSVSLRSQGRAWIEDDELNPLTLVEGEAPVAPDEVVLDRRLAEDAGTGVGDGVRLETPAGVRSATVSGISRFGDRDALDDGGTISFPPGAAVEVLNSGVPGYSDVLVRTEADADPGEVAQRLAPELPGSVEIQTREEFIETATADSAAFIDVLRPVLQGFAYLAMFVAAFVIFNTFSVVVTQRTRELALIRAIGGTPAQVRRSLLLEGLAVGIGASALGILAGVAVTHGIFWVLGRFDLGLPDGRVSLTPGTVLLGLGVGTLVTVLSVLVPAFRAGRTKPVEAMRSSAVDTSGTSTARAVAGGLLLLGSLLLLGANQLLDPQWYLIAPGALLLFAGLVVGGPLLARLFAMAVRPLLSTVGLTGRLAADNSVRNPKRTATTANALVIGLFLVTLVTVSGEAMKSAVVDELNQLSSSDFIVAAERAVDPELVDEVAGTEGVAATAPVRFGVTTLVPGDSPVLVTTADLDALAETAGTAVIAGDADAVGDGDAIAVPDLTDFGGGGGQPTLGLGDTVAVRDVEGGERTLRTEAVLEGSLDSLFLGYLVGEETFEDLVGEQPVALVFVRVEPGEAEGVGRRLEDAASGYTGVEIQAGNFIGQLFATAFDFLVGAVNALLGMSVIVALVGIVNTMTLSIFERRPELGMVRALGMTRGQVGRMVRAEAVLIGLLGTLVGMTAGVVLSWVVVSSVADGAIGLSFNWARVGLIFAVGVLVGLAASVLPSRRATRLDMLDAMRSE